MEFLDKNGVSIMWNKIKDNFLSTSGGTIWDNQTITFREIAEPGPGTSPPVNQNTTTINADGIAFSQGYFGSMDEDEVDVTGLSFIKVGTQPLISRITNATLDTICV